MRMAFGLLGLIVTIGVIVWIMHTVELPQIQQDLRLKKDVTEQINQWSGKDPDGIDAINSLALAPVSQGDQVIGLKVVSINSTGAMAKHYALRPNDVIVGTMGLKLAEMGATDSNTMMAQVREAYAYGRSLEVQRAGSPQPVSIPFVK